MGEIWYLNIALGTLLQIALFARALRCRLLTRYPNFYLYVACTTISSVVLSMPKVAGLSSYAQLYWWNYALSALLRFALPTEVYRHVFPSGSAVRTRAAVFISTSLVVAAICLYVLGPAPGASFFPDVIRKIGACVGVWMILVIILASYYRLRIGLNIWGMAVGLLMFTGSELIYLAGMDLQPAIWPVWRFVHPIAFVFMLSIWTFALWNYRPNPEVTQIESVRARRLEMAWQERWMDVPRSPRKVLRP